MQTCGRGSRWTISFLPMVNPFKSSDFSSRFSEYNFCNKEMDWIGLHKMDAIIWRLTHVDEIVEDEIWHVGTPIDGKAEHRPELAAGRGEHQVLDLLRIGFLHQLLGFSRQHVQGGAGDHHLVHLLRPHFGHPVGHHSAVAGADQRVPTAQADRIRLINQSINDTAIGMRRRSNPKFSPKLEKRLLITWKFLASRATWRYISPGKSRTSRKTWCMIRRRRRDRVRRR